MGKNKKKSLKEKDHSETDGEIKCEYCCNMFYHVAACGVVGLFVVYWLKDGLGPAHCQAIC